MQKISRHLSICGHFYTHCRNQYYWYIHDKIGDEQMTMITVEVHDVVPANIKTVYAVIADYEVGHQAILPRPEFKEMKVIEGGYGAGTRLKLHIRLWGQSYYYEQVVEEPDVGRVILERDVNTGQVSTFTLEPLSETSTRVTITANVPLSKGLRGVLERLSQPTIMRKLFTIELKNLAAYVSRPEVAIGEE